MTEGRTLCPLGAPRHYRALLAPLPPKVRFVTRVTPDTDVVHLFATDRGSLAQRLASLVSAIRPDAAVWVSWPKKTAKVPTDVTEDVVREIALPLGLVDIKVCAIDETWSGLKLVLRKTRRPVGR